MINIHGLVNKLWFFLSSGILRIQILVRCTRGDTFFFTLRRIYKSYVIKTNLTDKRM